MEREPKPDKASFYGWVAFNAWADANGLGEDPEDWEWAWDLWRAAYIAGVNGKA